MNLVSNLKQLFARFRYPVSLPEEIGSALGINTSNSISFEVFLNQVTTTTPTRLKKFMTRDEAESAFNGALLKERFIHQTLCSYYFNEGWVEFVLQFDHYSRLRRVFLQHKNIKNDLGFEIPLKSIIHL